MNKCIASIALFILLIGTLLFTMNFLPTSPVDEIEQLKVNVSFKGYIMFTGNSNNEIESLKISTMNYAEGTQWQKMLAGGANNPYIVKMDSFGNDYIEITFENPTIGNNHYEVWSVVESVPKYVKFEESTVYSESILDKYVKSSKYVQSDDPDIVEMAEKITSGSKDKYEEAVKITHWVYDNIEYSLDFENVTRDAKWTLDVREGVCSEFAHLETALLRARGIPTRIVYGVAPHEFPDGWRTHTWVEAYLGKNWISFDPTWDKINKLDAAHIKLAVAPDQSFISEKANLTGVELSIEGMARPELKIEILETKVKEKKLFGLF